MWRLCQFELVFLQYNLLESDITAIRKNKTHGSNCISKKQYIAVMARVNRYTNSTIITATPFRALDMEGTHIAAITGLLRNTIKRYLRGKSRWTKVTSAGNAVGVREGKPLSSGSSSATDSCIQKSFPISRDARCAG